MTEPHPLRCNMCNFRNIAHSEHCPYYQDAVKQKIKLDGFDWGELEIITEIIGCASHSSAKSDAVLEDFENWCNMFDDYTCDSSYQFTPSLVLKKLRELRSQQKER